LNHELGVGRRPINFFLFLHLQRTNRSSTMVAKHHQKKKSKQVSAVSLKNIEKTRVEDLPLSILNDEKEDSDEDEMETELQQRSGQGPPGKKEKGIDTSAVVVYIGHLPNLLGEAELLKLLKQFGGSITHVRVSRSEKTGNSRGYAFVRIKESEVAEIVVDTLSGYLLFSNKLPGMHRRLVCHIVPPDKVHPRLFVRHTSAAKVAQERRLLKQAEPTVRSIDDLPKVTAKLIQQERRKRQAIEKAGIDYTDFPGYEKNSSSPSRASASDQDVSKERVNEEKKQKKHEILSEDPKATKSPKQSMDVTASLKSQKPKTTEMNDRMHAKPEKGSIPSKTSPSPPTFAASTPPNSKKRSSLDHIQDEKKQHKKNHKTSKRRSH
jgi:nucleolar protein 15